MKGIFYSIIAILFITPLVMITLANLNFYQTKSETITTNIVGNKLAAYSKSIDSDIPRAMDIMAKRSISAAIAYVETEGKPVNNSAASLSELITNGTLYGNVSSADFTVASWASLVKQKGELYGFETDVRVLNISFFSVDSYTVGVEITLSVNATNPAAAMELYRIYNRSVPVSIEGFNDPLYTLKTNGVLKRTIRAPNFTVSGVANFDIAVSRQLYMPSSEGPGFLDRLEGRLRASGTYNTTSSVTGLESVVYIPSMQANGVAIKQGQTTIDYLYFDTASYPGLQVNQSSYNWLKIDGVHASTYNITIV